MQLVYKGNWPVSSSRLSSLAVHESSDPLLPSTRALTNKDADRFHARGCSPTERLQRWQGTAEAVTPSTTDGSGAAEEVREPPRGLVRQ